MYVYECMYIYVFMHVCIVCTYCTCVHASTGMCMHICMHKYLYVCMCACMYCMHVIFKLDFERYGGGIVLVGRDNCPGGNCPEGELSGGIVLGKMSVPGIFVQCIFFVV